MTSFFHDLQPLPPDPMFGINAQCQADQCPDKINLTIGAYRDDDGCPYVLPSVKEAEARILTDSKTNHEYLALGGLEAFNSFSAQLVLGDESGASPVISENRVHSIQCVGGTGGLRLAVEFLKRLCPGAIVYLPAQTWPTHLNIMRHAGVSFKSYRYLKGLELDIDGMTEDLLQCPEGSIVLLHMVAHNPSGFDPSQSQWQRILNIVKQKRLLTLMDNAYQGFYKGLLEDAFAARLFASAGVEMLITCSYSKNFGLYGERVGCLHVVSKNSDAGPAIMSNLTALSRTLCSNCPTYGARIVTTILGDQNLRASWIEECAMMANRLNSTRAHLHALLVKYNTPGNWDHILVQGGMFSFTGIPEEAIARLNTHHHIYMLASGRISLAGLNTKNIERFVAAVTESLNVVNNNSV